MFSISMFVEIPRSSPFSSLFIRGEQHPWQPWRAHLLYFIRVQPILISFFSPWLLLEAQTSAFCALLFLDQFAIRQNTVCGETGRGLWRRTAVLHVLSFTVGHRVETATSPPPMFMHAWPCWSISAICLRWFSLDGAACILSNLSVLAQRESFILFAAKQMVIFDKRAALSWETRDH